MQKSAKTLKRHTDTLSEVRTYRKGDESAIARLFNLCFGQSGLYLPFSPELWRWRYLSCPGFDPHSVFLVQESGRIISALVMTYVEMLVNGLPKLVAIIGDVSTHPAHRHQGHATNLMTQAIELAKKRGCWAMHLTANPHGGAIRIYRALGFRTLVKPVTMVSPLRKENGTTAVGFLPSIPILFIDSILSIRSIRHFTGSTKLRVIEGADIRPSLFAQHETQKQRNGCLMMGEEYCRWFCSQRPEGSVGVFEVTSPSQTVGIATISSIMAMMWRRPVRLANISNLVITEDGRDTETIAEILMKLRKAAADHFDCVAATIYVDPRDTVTFRACQRARFFRAGESAAMIHPLGDMGKLHELSKGYWSQPLEAVKPVP